MKIELKNVTVSERLSEETMCFAADLWIDGKKIGTVSNRGTGGCDDFHGDRAAYKRADEWCKANLPPYSFDMGEGRGPLTGPTDLEMHVADLIERHISRKKLWAEVSKEMKSKVVILTGEHGEAALQYFKPRNGLTPLQVVPAVMAKHPSATVLNVLTRAEAKRVLLSHHG